MLTAVVGAAALPAAGASAVTMPSSPLTAGRTTAGPTTAMPTVSVPGSEIGIVLTSVSPAVITPEDELVITGRIVNSGAAAVEISAVRAATAYRGLDTRELVQDWSTGEATMFTNRPIGRDEEVAGELAPGEETTFRIDVEDGIAPPFDFATLPLLVEVELASPDAGDTTVGAVPQVPAEIAGQLRSYLVWDGETEYDHRPLRIGLLASVPLPMDPALWSADSEVQALAWQHAAGPGSEVVQTVSALAGAPITLLLDPQLAGTVSPPVTLAPEPAPDGELPDEDGTTDDPTDSPTTPPESTPPPDESGTEDEPAPTGTPGPTDSGSGPDAGAVTPAGATATSPGPGDTNGSDTNSSDTNSNGTDEDGADDDPPPSLPLPPEEDEVPAGDVDLAQAVSALSTGQLWVMPAGDPDLQALADLGHDPQEAVTLSRAEAPLMLDLTSSSAAAALAEGSSTVAWPVLGAGERPDPSWWARAWEAAASTGDVDGPLRAMVLPASMLAHEGHLTPAGVRPYLPGATGTELLAPVEPGTEDAEPENTEPEDGDTEEPTPQEVGSAGGGTPLLLGYEEQLSRLATQLGDPDAAGQAGQRLLAETLAIYQERPATDRTLLIAWPRLSAPDPESVLAVVDLMEQTPWAQPVTAGVLPAAATTHGPATDLVDPPGDFFGQAPETVLTEEGIAALRLTESSLVGAAELVPDGATGAAAWSQVLTGAYSSGWRLVPERWSQPRSSADAVAAEVLEGITVNPTTINFYADEGIIQLTVVNSLPVEVSDLRVQLTPGHQRLQVVQQPDPVTIGPGSRATVQFRAQARAAGQVQVSAEMSTPNGTRVGEVEEMTVRVQPTGLWVYWVLGGAAGVILILGLIRAWRRPKSPAPPAPALQDGGGTR